jgi:hypothetical protein
MRVLTVATILLLSTSLAPSFAQDEGKSLPSSQPQTVPVQPERSPQQSEQSREQEREGGEDVRVRRDWRAQERDGDRGGRMGQNDMGRMREKMGRDMDGDHRTVSRNWRMRPDDDRADRGSYDEDRPRRRVKVCFEYENGDEYCRYR